MAAPLLAPGIPLFRSFSDEKAKEFYVDFLGMTVAWEHRFEADLPLYMQVERDGLALHITGHHGDATPGSTVFVPVADIDSLQAELAARKASFARPSVQDVPWGREMSITDPFGNRIRFCQLRD